MNKFNNRQLYQLKKLDQLLKSWNSYINLVSRKEIYFLFKQHITLSLLLCETIEFKPFTKVLDIGTGGGLPGFPLAICYSKTSFQLVDSVKKKINIINYIADELQILNIATDHIRIRDICEKYDLMMGRSVAELSKIIKWTYLLLSSESRYNFGNGLLYIKGGSFSKLCKGISLHPNIIFKSNRKIINEKYISYYSSTRVLKLIK